MRIESLSSQNIQTPVSRQNAEVSSDRASEAEASKTTEVKATEEAEKKEESENTLDENVTAVSRDGDTLEISSDNNNSKGIMTKIPDASLAKYSKIQLQKMLKENKITKQQYDKAVKGK